MAIADYRDQALSLLTAANNHADLAVKLSSLKQAKDILSSPHSSSAADLFPYLVDLQRSPHSLVKNFLVEIIEDITLKAMEHSSILVPVLVAFLRDVDSNVVRQSIVSGTNFFCSVLEEMELQPGPVGTKLLALKFLETYVLLFTSDNVDSEKIVEATRGSRRTFNVSWLSSGHPILDPVALTSDANRTLFVLLDMLRSASSLPGSVTINVVNCLKSSGGLKAVWRMPKLWVGFLKCVAQTQPHSFHVLLQMPPPQLESALNKYGSLRSSLAAYASQPTTKGSLPRSTLAVLGLANESHMQQPHMSTLHPSDTSSVQGATLT